MVVTRRAPAAVPTSRTNSSQPIPRVKAQAQQLQATPDETGPLDNGTESEGLPTDVLGEAAAKKAKGKWKNKSKKEKQKRKKASSAFVELLTRIFLLWFTVYTITVCPNDEALKSPICRGLSAYRHYVLDPYLIPPVQRALAHPSIAPYVDRVTPVIQSSIDTAKPILIRANLEWNQRVVPQWKRRIVPQWHKHVDPQLDKHVWPRIQHVQDLVTPYITTAQHEYDRKIAPPVRFALHKLEIWQHQAHPYVILAAHKTYDWYQIAKPYARPVLEHLQALLLRLFELLQEQRRQFVDPHVHKIWERVKELSGESKPITTISNAFTASVSKAIPTTSSFLSSPLETFSTLAPSASEPVIASASTVPSIVVSETKQSPSSYSSASPSLDSVVAPIQSVSSLASAVTSRASSVAKGPASSVASSISVDNEAILSASSLTEEALVPSASQVESASASASVASAKIDHIASEASPVVGSVTEDTASLEPSITPTQSHTYNDSDEDVDLEDLYAELGLDDLDSEPTDEHAPEPIDETVLEPEPEEEDEEAKAERLRLAKEATARKRAELVARHTNWENKLIDRIAQARKELRKSLVASRKAAAAELKQSPEIRKEIDSFVEDAGKYLKGAEKYLAQSVKDTKSGRSNEEKQTMWTRVVDKIEKRFEERIGQTEAVVNGWYEKVLNAEVAEVMRLREEVKSLAEDAQGDIGLDYAWLDDVTYTDWQRYHDLERRATNFTKEAMSIQDGTHPSPPINPIAPAIDDLQSEVQDIVLGFENRLKRVQRKGERAFGAVVDDTNSDDVSSDETVSILPHEDGVQNADERPAVPPVFIGRSKEEIVSVLNRVAEQEAQSTSSPDVKDADPEQVVAGLAREVAEEGNLASSPVKHEEL